MAERLRRRRHMPHRRHLTAALRFLHEKEQAELAFEAAILEAARDGWSMREIAAAVGLSASTVCRIVNAAERAA
jgi:DNA-binding NarL/FixJ family response regulator